MKLKLTGAFALVSLALTLLAQPAPCQIASVTQQQATTAADQARANAQLHSDQLLHAVHNGDIKKIRFQVGEGADVNLPGSAFDVEDIQAVADGFRYKFKSEDRVGGSLAMLEAIESARPESVQALISLGVDPKAEFYQDADLGLEGSPLPPGMIVNAIRNGLGLTVSGTASEIPQRGTDGFVHSSIRPSPAKKTTYLSVAERRLAKARNAKEQRQLQQIVDILRQAASQ